MNVPATPIAFYQESQKRQLTVKLQVLNLDALMLEAEKHILIVDADVAVVEPLRHKLSDAGFVVRMITDAAAASELVAQRPPHLVIVDWNVRGLMVLDLIRRTRAVRFPQPVRLIILSALADEQEVVAGLDIGADDYIVKPFSLREAVARVCAVLRPRQRSPRPAALACDSLVLDLTYQSVTARGQPINLTGIEYRLLEFLMSNAGRTFSRAQLLEFVWGDDAALDSRTVDVNVRRLRKMLSEQGFESYVRTVRGYGYRFAVPDAGSSDAPSAD